MSAENDRLLIEIFGIDVNKPQRAPFCYSAAVWEISVETVRRSTAIVSLLDAREPKGYAALAPGSD
ncbi:MAG: hypothetical protein WAK31_01985 [Chthoniobacterales bacterium]